MLDRINGLTDKQLEALPQEIDATRKPVRFLANGQAVNLCTGICHAKGSNIINHNIYWDRPLSFVSAAIAELKANNPGVKITITYH